MSTSDVVLRAHVAKESEIPAVVKAAILETYKLTKRVDQMSPGSVLSASAYSDAASLSSVLKRLALKADPKTRKTIGVAVNALGKVQLQVIKLVTPDDEATREARTITGEYEAYTRTVKKHPHGSVGGLR